MSSPGKHPLLSSTAAWNSWAELVQMRSQAHLPCETQSSLSPAKNSQQLGLGSMDMLNGTPRFSSGGSGVSFNPLPARACALVRLKTNMMIAPLVARWLAVFFTSTIVASLASAAVALVENGAAKADVIVAANATPAERAAANELVQYLKKATGAELPIASERSPGRPAVLIGSAAPGAAREKIARLRGESHLMEVQGDTIVLTGNGREGTLFAVYEFLEHVAGIRWLWPGEVGEVVPRQRTLSVDNLSRTKEPAFLWRFLGPGGSLWGPHDKWTKERELNISTGHQAAQRLWERRNRFGGERISGGHAFGDILPPQTWGAKHPEYYALVKGKRDWENFNGKHRAQLCTTNPEVIQRVTDYCRTHFDADPDLDGVSIAANDGRGFCECDNCRRLDTGRMQKENNDPEQLRPAETPIITDRMVTFCNQVAESLAKTHPNRKVLFYAYSQFHEPPERTRVHPNVVMAYTVNSSGFWNEAVREKAFGDFAAWSRVTPTFAVYEYHTQTNFPDMPRLIPDLIQVELKELQRLGSRYFHTQAGNGFAVNGLNFYMLGRLLWDPSADVKALQADYVQRAFGPAAAAMGRYYDRFIASWRDQKSAPVRMLAFANYDEVVRAYPRDVRAAARADLEEALRTATGEHQRRVEFVRDGFQFFEQTMLATEATHPFVKAGWRIGAPAPAGTDPRQLERALELWRARDAYVEEHREDFVLSYLWVRANMENGFNPLKRLRAAAEPGARR
jgi:hypothetical protein